MVDSLLVFYIQLRHFSHIDRLAKIKKKAFTTYSIVVDARANKYLPLPT